jgi:hypothetical protein
MADWPRAAAERKFLTFAVMSQHHQTINNNSLLYVVLHTPVHKTVTRVHPTGTVATSENCMQEEEEGNKAPAEDRDMIKLHAGIKQQQGHISPTIAQEVTWG